ALTAAGVVVGSIAGTVYNAQFVRLLVDMVANVPGGVGEFLASILRSGAWIIVALATLIPMIVVRAARRRRVQGVEEDLPLALELFATMGEAGLGFDAALAKIVHAQERRRPLVVEFVNFQLDMLAGMSRLQALRQLARRVEVGSLTSFTSALIQAE